MTEPVCTVIGGRYQIMASLGQGGMGLVYKAYDPVLDRTVALKKMLATVVDGEESRQRFFIEARAAARLNHPNIVTIYELEEHDGDIYIVMELLEGVSLAGFLRNPVPLSLAGYLTIIAQVAEGLHYAHGRAIVHRDIKPANLVLTTDGGVKILDFGIAQHASYEITQKGAMLGTPHYMAPEQIRGEPVDARADLFALGGVAYELVTGVKAFTADSVAALLMRITEMPHRPVREVAPDTSPALAAIIDRLLAKDRAQRPWNGNELCQALERIGEIDRSDLVAEAVRAVLGPVGDETTDAPTAGDPSPIPKTTLAGSSPRLPTPSLPTPPPLPTMPFSTPPFSTPASPSRSRRTRAFAASTSATGAIDSTIGPPPVATPPRVTPPLAASPIAAPPIAAPLIATPPIATPLPPPVAVSPPSSSPRLPSPRSPSLQGSQAPSAAALPPSLPAGRAPDALDAVHSGAGMPPVGRAAPGAVEPRTSSSANVASGAAVASGRPLPLASVPVTPGGARVDPGVPQARTRRGSGAALIAIAALFVLAFAGTGWWAYANLQRWRTQGRTVEAASNSASSGRASPNSASPSSASSSRASSSSASPNGASSSGAPSSGAPSSGASSSMAATMDASKPTGGTQEAASRQQPADTAATAPTARVPTPQAPQVAPLGATPVRVVQSAATPAAPESTAVRDTATDAPVTPGGARRPPTARETTASLPPSAPDSQKPDRQQAVSQPAGPPSSGPQKDGPQRAGSQKDGPQKPDEHVAPRDARVTPPTGTRTRAMPPRHSLVPEPIPSDPILPDASAPATKRADAAPKNPSSRDVPPRAAPSGDAAPGNAPRRESAPREVARNEAPEPPTRPTVPAPREPAPREPAAKEPALKEPGLREPALREPPRTEPAATEPAPRDRPRDPSAREPEADRRTPLDPSAVAVFQNQGRSGPGSNVYTESPSSAAAVARITYTLEAYSDAVAQGDLEALREVRSPVTPAEAAFLKEANTTVQFSNLGVSVSGTDGLVRCRRAIVTSGKTRSSGLVEVHLTRRPSGWVITDIR